MENHDYEDWPVTEETRLSGKTTIRFRGRLQPPTAQGDDEIYNPPAWRVCSNCDGSGVETDMPTQGDYFPKDEKCLHCLGTGRIPIRYTPDEWTDEGGVLSDDTQVYYDIGNGVFRIASLESLKDHSDWIIIIAIPGQDRPPTDWRPKEEHDE
jgi:hypothetical protein